MLRAQLESSIKSLDGQDVFLEKLARGGRLAAGRSKFADWIQTDDWAQCFDLLRLLRAIFTFEVNRPHDGYWYATPPKFEEAELTAYTLGSAADEQENVKELKEILQRYITSTKEYIES
jgi:hypothetical protein